jgi:1,6-anhydro-N-acetylmuramate kinase
MHDQEKSDSGTVAEADEQGRATGGGAGGAKAGDQGERGAAKHTPDTELGRRIGRRRRRIGQRARLAEANCDQPFLADARRDQVVANGRGAPLIILPCSL